MSRGPSWSQCPFNRKGWPLVPGQGAHVQPVGGIPPEGGAEALVEKCKVANGAYADGFGAHCQAQAVAVFELGQQRVDGRRRAEGVIADTYREDLAPHGLESLPHRRGASD